MTPSHLRARTLRRHVAILCAALSLAACHDAASDPVAVVLTEESRAALLVEGETASLPGLVARAGIDGALSEAVHGWVASWEEEGERSSELREEAYALAAGPLVDRLGPAVTAESNARLDAALRAAEAVPAAELTSEMARRVGEARRLHDEAVSLLAVDRSEEALVRVLRASDHLRAVGPEGVARALTARAERALDSTPAGSSGIDRERADRLARGARAALEDGAWTRAIRRAYYACQVLGASTR